MDKIQNDCNDKIFVSQYLYSIIMLLIEGKIKVNAFKSIKIKKYTKS